MNTRFALCTLHITCSEFHLPVACIYCYLRKRFCTPPKRPSCKSPSTFPKEETQLLFNGKCFLRFFYPEKIDCLEHTVVLKDWPLKPFLNRPFEGGQTSHKTNTQKHIVFYMVVMYVCSTSCAANFTSLRLVFIVIF